jgi:RNA recognition motif-containing protein
MKLFVNKLNSETSEDSLREIFEVFGGVTSSKIVFDKTSGKSRGFAFIDMRDEKSGEAAMKALHGSELDGRRIVVELAIEKRAPSTTEGYIF